MCVAMENVRKNVNMHSSVCLNLLVCVLIYYPSIPLLHPLLLLEPLQAITGRRRGYIQDSLLPITCNAIYLSKMLYVCKLLQHAVKRSKYHFQRPVTSSSGEYLVLRWGAASSVHVCAVFPAASVFNK